MLTIVRVQEKGQVTIPQEVRRKLNLRKGDMVTFMETADGMVVRPVSQAAQQLQSALEKSLARRSVELSAVLEQVETLGGEEAARQFALSSQEKNLLYQMLQLRAQVALESIRSAAEASGLYETSDTEIEAEIQAARQEH